MQYHSLFPEANTANDTLLAWGKETASLSPYSPVSLSATEMGQLILQLGKLDRGELAKTAFKQAEACLTLCNLRKNSSPSLSQDARDGLEELTADQWVARSRQLMFTFRELLTTLPLFYPDLLHSYLFFAESYQKSHPEFPLVELVDVAREMQQFIPKTVWIGELPLSQVQQLAESSSNQELLDAVSRFRQAPGPSTKEDEYLFPFNTDEEFWAVIINHDLHATPHPERAAWSKLFHHALPVNSSTPTKKWLKAAQELVNELGPEKLSQRLMEWLPHIPHSISNDGCATSYTPEFREMTNVMRGLIWAAQLLPPSTEMITLLADFAKRCFAKSYAGPLCPKLATATLVTLSAYATPQAIQELNRLSKKAYAKSSKSAIAKALASIEQTS